MRASKPLAASLMATAFALGGVWLVLQDHLVAAGTLFVLCSFSIYLREKTKE